MYYSAIGLLAAIILVIENYDILLKRSDEFNLPVWKIYRYFLISVLIYYLSDILWGIFDSLHLSVLLFADTSVYFIAMAAGVLFWSRFTVDYLEEDNRFGKFLIWSGQILSFSVTFLTIINIFLPILFVIDETGTYHALNSRYIILIAQILLLAGISVYALISYLRKSDFAVYQRRYRTLALFGLIMAIFLIAQLQNPYLPLYSVAYMLGTSLLRAFIIRDEKADYQAKLAEAFRIKETQDSITSLLDNMPGLNFSKDAKTGVYLVCNQAFAEYAHKENPAGVAGLTDADIFDAETAKHFVEDDRMAMSMDEPYIFFEDVPDAAGNQRQFQTTKLKFTDPTGRLCLLGMCTDVTDMVKIQRENATTKEAYEKARGTGIIYSHIARTLAASYMNIFYVNLETEEFIEYFTGDARDTLIEARRGNNFFEECRIEALQYVHPEDQDAFLQTFDRKTLLERLEKNEAVLLTYRLIGYFSEDQKPIYVTMKITRMSDDRNYIIIAITDVDEQMKQRSLQERLREERIAYSRINALTGDFLSIYIVVPETGRYRRYSTAGEYEKLRLPEEGMDFFQDTRDLCASVVYPDDIRRFQSLFTREAVLSEIERTGMFALSYRMMINGSPLYVMLKAAMVEEAEGKRLIIGINDIDSQVRQEAEYEKRLIQAQTIANIDALTGVKNKHAYLEAEERINRRIKEQRQGDFAVVILDVNDLKKVNDNEGHQAGDQYLRDACRIICTIFKHSPVYRVGGDEFAVVSEGTDCQRIEELVGKMYDHDARAQKSGGIVIACGMSRFQNDSCVAEVFERADLLMYENKTSLKCSCSPEEAPA